MSAEADGQSYIDTRVVRLFSLDKRAPFNTSSVGGLANV